MIRTMLRALALALLLAGPAAASPTAAEVLEQAKAASGGKAWDALQGSYEKGSHGPVPYETWLDFRAYGMRMAAGGRAQGFDGQAPWREGPDGKAQPNRDPAAVREAITTAFVSNNGFFFPDRFPATARYLREEAGFDVLEIEPAGGRAIELWFDRKTRLLGKVGDPHGPQPVTVSLSDYRKVGDVLIAFRGVVTAPDGRILDEGRVSLVEHRAVPRSLFAAP